MYGTELHIHTLPVCIDVYLCATTDLNRSPCVLSKNIVEL